MNPTIAILLSVFLGVVGQILIKHGVNLVGSLVIARGSLLATTWRIGSSPYIVGGLAVYGLSMLLWLAALSRVELGFAYPFISLSYVLITLASYFVFREEISIVRLLGLAFICVGVYAVASG